MAQSAVYDLILMDCHMPELDDYEATVKTRESETLERLFSIVALTASAMQQDRDKCFAAGMDDYLAKPVTRATLQFVLERWCSGMTSASGARSSSDHIAQL